MQEMLELEELDKRLRLRVRAGMGRLDGHFGNGTWVHRIRLDRLSMRTEEHCILTQVFDYFVLGLRRLELLGDPKNAAAFGFAVAGHMSIDERNQEYAVLTGIWKEEISARLRIAGPPGNEGAVERQLICV